MRAGQVKTMINDNLQVPLSLAPIPDANKNKYYPEFKLATDLTSTDVVVVPCTATGGQKSDVYDAKIYSIPASNGIYTLRGTSIVRLDLLTLEVLAEQPLAGLELRNLNMSKGEDLIYVQDLSFKIYRLDPLTLKVLATSQATATLGYNFTITNNGVYFTVATFIYRLDLITLALLATSATLTGWGASDGCVITDNIAIRAIRAGSVTSSTPNGYTIATIYNPLTLAVAGTRTFIAPDTGTLNTQSYRYSQPKIYGGNTQGYLITHRVSFSASGTAEISYEYEWYSYSATGVSITNGASPDIALGLTATSSFMKMLTITDSDVYMIHNDSTTFYYTHCGYTINTNVLTRMSNSSIILPSPNSTPPTGIGDTAYYFDLGDQIALYRTRYSSAATKTKICSEARPIFSHNGLVYGYGNSALVRFNLRRDIVDYKKVEV